MPGKIVSFNPSTMTAVVQPAIQAMHKQDDGSIKPVDIHPIADVPVHFPGGGGHALTFPVRAGDECMIVFQERSIDNWFQHGGTQQPSDYRMHDINDAIVHVGLRSQPHVLSGFSAGTTQLRSDDGNTVVDLNGAGGQVTIRTTGAITIKTAGETTIDCPKLTVTGNIECKGEVTAQHGGPFVTLSKHVHPAINQPPTPLTRDADPPPEEYDE